MSIQVKTFLETATRAHASDIFIVAGLPLTYKVNGTLHSEGERLMPADTEDLIRHALRAMVMKG